MLAFVDESGDSGRKILNRSSRYFVVAVVIFRDNDDAHACDDAIAQLRRRLNLPARYEFHYAENPLKVKRAFLSTVASQRFEYLAFVVDKEPSKLAHAQEIANEPNLYRYAMARAFQNVQPLLDNATMVMDRIGDRRARDQIATYLRQSIRGTGGRQLIGKVKMQRSDSNNLLQLADYAAGVVNRSLIGKLTDATFRQQYLAQKEVSVEIWP